MVTEKKVWFEQICIFIISHHRWPRGPRGRGGRRYVLVAYFVCNHSLVIFILIVRWPRRGWGFIRYAYA